MIVVRVAALILHERYIVSLILSGASLLVDEYVQYSAGQLVQEVIPPIIKFLRTAIDCRKSTSKAI